MASTDIRAALDRGLERLTEHGIAAEQCLVPASELAEQQIIDALQRAEWDCVVVGGGIRKPLAALEFFEAVINLIREHAPGASIAFNTTGVDSLEAVMRQFKAPESLAQVD
jgi:hypothetical protein